MLHDTSYQVATNKRTPGTEYWEQAAEKPMMVPTKSYLWAIDSLGIDMALFPNLQTASLETELSILRDQHS